MNGGHRTADRIPKKKGHTRESYAKHRYWITRQGDPAFRERTAKIVPTSSDSVVSRPECPDMYSE
jgi:hypothetical protein